MAKGLRWTEDELLAFAQRGNAAQRAVIAAARQPGKTNLVRAVVQAATRHESKLEIRFDQQLAVQGLLLPIKNYLFLKDRDLELDRAWPQWKLGVEIQGGAHRASMANLARDCEKMCLALLAGWWILPFSRELIRSERAMEILLAAIELRKKGSRATTG